MRRPVASQVVLISLAYAVMIAAKADPNYNASLNFRPNNVSLSDLYHWVGSYVVPLACPLHMLIEQVL